MPIPDEELRDNEVATQLSELYRQLQPLGDREFIKRTIANAILAERLPAMTEAAYITAEEVMQRMANV